MNQICKAPVFETENARILGKDFRDITKKIQEAGAIGDGTIVLRFRNYKKQGYMALMTIINDQYPASYLTAYIKHANQVGFLKNIINEDRCITKALNIHADQPMDYGYVNTMAMTAKNGEGYTLYYNGKKIQFVPDVNAALLSDIIALGPIDRAMLGDFLEPQKMHERHYSFHGDIDFIRMYDEVLQEEYLLEFTGQSKCTYEVPMQPENKQAAAVSLFDQGMYGSRSYRIPTILRTKEKTLLAFIDQRFYGGADQPNRIHTILRRSEDLGNTWGEPIKVIAMPKNALTIDTCSVQDESTGRIFVITDAFPESLNTFNAQAGTGWKTENGELCRILVDGKNEEYLVHLDGCVCKNDEDTGMKLTSGDELHGAQGEELGNIWTENAFLRIYPTNHLFLLFSDDDGKSWELQCDLNVQTKEEWMNFYGCGPGIGIQLQYGANRGRLVLPVYFFNSNNRQSAALIYSDDHGETWHRGASPTDGWQVDGKTLHSQSLEEHTYETLEAQLVEMPDSRILYYMRSGKRMAMGAYSSDGGETWDTEKNFYDTALTGPGGQFGIIRYDGKIDSKDAYCCTIHLDGKNYGTVKIGLVEETEDSKGVKTTYINWKYSKTIRLGSYSYSCACNISPEVIAVFYESSSSASMTFQKLDIGFLKSPEIRVDIPEILSSVVTAVDNGLEAEVIWNQPIMPMGKLEVIIEHKGETWTAPLCKRTVDSKGLIFCVKNAKAINMAECAIIVPDSLEIYTRRGDKYGDENK